MTFLVLLLSVAVLEYVLRRAEPMPSKGQPFEEKELKAVLPGPAENAPVSLAQSLGQLGEAVEQFGHGAVPDRAPTRTPDLLKRQ